MSEAAGNVFVIVAPSGAGKSSLVKALLAQDPSLSLSVSFTTRKPRDGEVDGVDYRFLSMSEFEKLRDTHQLLEWAQVHENFYGTPRDKIDEAQACGKDILLEIDWQGASQIRNLVPNLVGIFILPPSLEELKERLIRRGTDTPQVIDKRIAAANEEISHSPEFEYIVINQIFSDALLELKQIIAATRLRYPSQYARHRQLFEQFNLKARTQAR